MYIYYIIMFTLSILYSPYYSSHSIHTLFTVVQWTDRIRGSPRRVVAGWLSINSQPRWPEYSPQEFSPQEFSPQDFSPYGFFAVRIFRRRNFRRTEFSPYGIFAVRNFRRMEFSPYGIFAVRIFRRNPSIERFYGVFKLRKNKAFISETISSIYGSVMNSRTTFSSFGSVLLCLLWLLVVRRALFNCLLLQ